jgi:gas vesicle protein
MAESKSDGLLGGLIIGAALGAIAGVLAAPRPGKDTRRILKKSADALPELAEDLATSIQFQADRLSDTTLINWDKTLERLREAVSAGQIASRREWKRQQSSYSNDYSNNDYSNGDGVTSLTEDE